MRTFLRAIVAAAIFVSLHISAFSQQVAKTIPNSTAPEGLIGFLEFRPSDYGSQKHPLIIFLHGYGERGNGTSQVSSVAVNGIPNLTSRGATMRFTVGGQTSSFVVLSPQLSTWYGYWPTFYIREMIKYAKANLSIDPNRIYITGLSLGGGATWRAITEAGTENGDYSFDAGIAAAAPVCGTQEMNDGNFCKTIGANHLPVWAFHCMDDGTVGVGTTQHGEILASICGVTPTMKFTYYQSGGHGGAWVNAYDTGHITRTVSGGGNFTANPNLYEWFLSNTRGATAPVNNTAPVSNAGNAQTITLPTNSVTLSGTGTGTNGASISSYAWVKTSGPASGTINAANSASTVASGLAQGNYVFTLTVTDNHGLTNSSAVNITVNAAPNTAPVAAAGNAQTITLPTNSVTLSGTGTGTNGASISSYAWVKTSGPSSGSISSAGTSSTTVTGLAQGTYVFTLTVTDNHGLTNSAAVTITVNAAAQVNTAPVASAGGTQTITLPTNSVTLSGTGTGTNGASISSYAWLKTSGPSSGSISAATSASTSVTALSQGTYVFTLTVTDNHGLTNSSSTTVTVNALVAAIPSTPAANTPLGYVRVDGSADIACADVSTANRVAVYGTGIANGNVLYTNAEMTVPYVGNWNWFSFTPTLGSATTYAFAMYPNGGIFYLKSCSIATITPPTTNPPTTSNTPPVANAGSPQTITLPTSTVTLSGSGWGTNGASVASSRWVETSGPSTLTISAPGAASTLVSGFVQGSYLFTLSVNDTRGATTTATVTVTVNAAAAAPAPVTGNLLGYIKIDGSSDIACADISTSGRIAVYGKGIANGNALYTDAAMTIPYVGNWNWFSFTPTLGSATTYAFAAYPNGVIFYLRNCGNAGTRIAAVDYQAQDAALQRMKDSAALAATTINTGNGKLSMYPNPVHTNATIELKSTDEGLKTIFVYNNVGVLKARYTWQTIKGNNSFSLKEVSGLANGFYIIDVRDNSGKSVGSLKFLKM